MYMNTPYFYYQNGCPHCQPRCPCCGRLLNGDNYYHGFNVYSTNAQQAMHAMQSKIPETNLNASSGPCNCGGK